jgi:hypothetical protein
MTDDQALAATLDDTKIETPVNDGIIDLDALEEVKEDDEGKAKDADAKDDGDKEEPAKKPSGAQRAKIRETRLLNELQAREREIEELRSKTPAAQAGEDEAKPPREEDYNGDWFAFQRALTAFDAGKAASEAINKQFKNREDSERQTKQTEIVRERKIAHAERVEDAREVIADFDQVMEGMKGVNVRDELIDEIMSSEHSAVLAYHLAKNPDKLNAMNGMSGRELAREMGRLEATVRLPEAKKATTAPAPLSRPKGGASPSSADSDLAAWMKKTYG